MKFWRTFAVLALVTAFVTPASAKKICAKETNKSDVFPLVQCPGFQSATNTAVGNGFPWENSSFFFASFRNQYLFDSAALGAGGAGATSCSIESVQSRSVSFIAGSTNVYGSFLNGSPSTITAEAGLGGLVPTFAFNSGGAALCSLTGTDAAPIVIGSMVGPNGSTLSSCTSCDPAVGDGWCNLGDIDALPADGIMFDHTLSVGTGNSGAGVWDTNSTAFGGGCAPGGLRAFGSGTFANPNALTTALGVDNFDFVWVFAGKAPPPPATVAQQISEIVRLLLTPQGLRCSSLDLTPGNDKVDDNPVDFPNGRYVDTMSPQISSGGEVSGDELGDARRSGGYSNLP
jgi:hypothetical protein